MKKIYFMWRYVRDGKSWNRYSPDFKLEPTYPEFTWKYTINCIPMEDHIKKNWELPMTGANLWYMDVNDDIYDTILEEINWFGVWVRVKVVSSAEAMQWMNYYTDYPINEQTDTYTKYEISPESEDFGEVTPAIYLVIE